MNDADRKYLTEWGGECWHDAENDETCSKCGKSFRGYYLESTNRTFTTWEDFGWLVERLTQKDLTYSFASWWWYRLDEPLKCMSTLSAWLSLRPEITCQHICDFLREQEKGGEG